MHWLDMVRGAACTSQFLLNASNVIEDSRAEILRSSVIMTLADMRRSGEEWGGRLVAQLAEHGATHFNQTCCTCWFMIYLRRWTAYYNGYFHFKYAVGRTCQKYNRGGAQCNCCRVLAEACVHLFQMWKDVAGNLWCLKWNMDQTQVMQKSQTIRGLWVISFCPLKTTSTTCFLQKF